MYYLFDYPLARLCSICLLIPFTPSAKNYFAVLVTVVLFFFSVVSLYYFTLSIYENILL